MDTIQFTGDDLLEHEMMLLKCFDQKDYSVILDDTVDDYELPPITDTRPTIQA